MDRVREVLSSEPLASARSFEQNWILPQLARIEKAILEDPLVADWLNSQISMTGGAHLHSINVATWLHDRCQSIGLDAALSELEAVVRVGSGILPLDVMLFDSLGFASSNEVVHFEFANGISLAALEVYKDSVVFPAIDEFPLTCILTSQHDSSGRFIERCIDVCRFLSLARPPGQAVQPKLFTKGWRKNAPFPQGRDIGLVSRPRAKLNGPLLHYELKNSNDLLGIFASFAGKDQDVIRTVLDHYSYCGSSLELVESAVHMRICLETLLISSGSGDNLFKVSRRGALMLGGDLVERERNCNLIIGAYKAGSSAVHTASVKSSERSQWREFLGVLQKLVRCWIAAGAPSLSNDEWKLIELGGGFPPIR
ncbi:hypothetical protein [Tropicimonas sp. IMCC34011]|uniref:hypothetical protein n=1 Tax=Tropicimonas sp. IMCC34011 TaxID=2248759 RepID=UPI001300896D|nr:hypothetical protein [Tropicimonas sp. IMCC34011]